MTTTHLTGTTLMTSTRYPESWSFWLSILGLIVLHKSTIKNVILQGSDNDDNGLTIQMENAEACFYQALGWLNSEGDKVIKDVITEDLDNLKDANIKQTFKKDINLCINWNGKFGPSRMKRSAEDQAEEVNFTDD